MKAAFVNQIRPVAPLQLSVFLCEVIGSQLCFQSHFLNTHQETTDLQTSTETITHYNLMAVRLVILMETILGLS